MKVAVVVDWLMVYAGAERVLEQILLCYPDADVYALIEYLPADQRGFLQGKAVRTSFMQHLPFVQRKYRQYLLLMPLAIEQFDLTSYDLVISSSHAVAKGVITGPDQIHISYVHSPMRYAWDLQFQYLKESGLEHGLKGWIAKWMLHRMRLWDVRTAHGVDSYLANSYYVGRRIRKTYGRESEVIYPPVDVENFTPCDRKDDYYLTASRMVPYKKIDVIVEAFSLMPEKSLVVIGDGPDFEKIRKKAGRNVHLLGYQTSDSLRDHMRRARAFIFAAEEDFGIVPVEAQASGTPVIAYGRGGVLETIRGLEDQHPTGTFFDVQNPGAIAAAVGTFERSVDRIDPAVCRENALRFDPARFRREFTESVEKGVTRFR